MSAVTALAEDPRAAPIRTPRARRELEITEPAGRGRRSVVHDPRAGRYLKLGATTTLVLRALDGERSIADVADASGITPAQAQEVVALFASHGLLEEVPSAGGFLDNDLVHARSRIRRTGLLSVQVDLVNPNAIFDRAGIVARLATGSAFWIAAALGLLISVIGGIAHANAIERVATAPVPALPALLAVLALLATIVAHELAHAGIAWRAGARARRMGLMVMYLMPSMFCDVSDCWRLPRRIDRVKVAAAGMAMQAILVGFALSATFIPGIPAQAVTGLLLYGITNALLVAFNLIPLVRLDGYLMLMSALDIPNLRAKAIADAHATLVQRLTGKPRTVAALPHRGLTLTYGIACAIAPLLLSTYGLTRVHALLVPLGALGALVWLAGLGLLAVELGRRVRKSRLWIVAVCLGLAAGASAISVPRQVDGSFAVVGGHVELLLSPDLSHSVVPGDVVSLDEPGLIASRVVGRAAVAGGGRGLVGTSVAPSAIEGLGEPSGPLVAVALTVARRGIAARTGTAVVTHAHESLFARVANVYFTSSLRLL